MARGLWFFPLSVALWLTWALCGSETARADDANAASASDGRAVLDIAYSASIFSDVDVNDALAATGVWVESILRQKTGNEIGLNSFVVQGGSQLIAAYRAGAADLVVTSPLEYLAVADSIDLAPILVGSSEAGPLDEFLLVVNRSSGIESLESLGGKELIMEVAARGELPGMWLDILLMVNDLPPAQGHLRTVRRVDRTARALLPVFFNQTDACVVTRRAFDLMVELNPQIGDALAALYCSPGYSRSLLCLRPGLYEEHRSLLEVSLLALHEEPRGQQILQLFHLERLIPFERHYLDAVAALVATYEDLSREPEL